MRYTKRLCCSLMAIELRFSLKIRCAKREKIKTRESCTRLHFYALDIEFKVVRNKTLTE